jgi:hypothetical protein
MRARHSDKPYRTDALSPSSQRRRRRQCNISSQAKEAPQRAPREASCRPAFGIARAAARSQLGPSPAGHQRRSLGPLLDCSSTVAGSCAAAWGQLQKSTPNYCSRCQTSRRRHGTGEHWTSRAGRGGSWRGRRPSSAAAPKSLVSPARNQNTTTFILRFASENLSLG